MIELEDLICYAFGLDDELCDEQIENLNRLFISRQYNPLDLRDDIPFWELYW